LGTTTPCFDRRTCWSWILAGKKKHFPIQIGVSIVNPSGFPRLDILDTKERKKSKETQRAEELEGKARSKGKAMAMAWLAHAKGVRKGKGKGSTPSGASKGNGKLAVEDAHEEGENQELAGKLSVGKRFKSGKAKEAAAPESLKKSEDEPKEKKKDLSGEECEPKKKKKNKNDEEVKKNNDNTGEGTEERKGKNTGKNGAEDKNGEEANAAKKRKNKNNNEEGNEEPLTVKKKSKRAKEPSDGTPEAEDKDESAPEISAADKKKRKNDMARALRVPTKAFEECGDEGEEEANLKKKPSKATWTEEPEKPKKMQGKVGHPLVRLRTKTSEESLDSRHVTPDRPTTKPASPGSSGTSRSSEFNA